jgi:hypothetical protein
LLLWRKIEGVYRLIHVNLDLSVASTLLGIMRVRHAVRPLDFHVASMLRGAADIKWEALKILANFLQHDAT